MPGEDKGYVRLNLRGRERDGIVGPGEADELLSSIADGLLSFADPDGSASIASSTRRSGPFPGSAPWEASISFP